jgi:uncharacterized oligopeptide transporter (OPT) family protein
VTVPSPPAAAVEFAPASNDPDSSAGYVAETHTPTAEPHPRRENTARALVTGCAIGVVLAAGNVYTGLKTAFIDGGSITAALLSFMLFSTFKRLGRTPYGALENNITQTTASSAAIMGFVAGLPGPIPALTLLGHSFPGWAIALMGAAIGMVGIFAATLLREKLVVEDALPFPTGRATAELIETMYAGRATAVRRAWLLGTAAAVAMALTWFRDGRPAVLPQTLAFGGAIAGVATSALTLGLSVSPLVFSTGAMVGLRMSTSMLLGAVIAYAGIAPALLGHGIVREAAYASLSSWLVWPALGLLLAGSFLPLLLEGGVLLRSLRDLGSVLLRLTAPAKGGPEPASARPRGLALLLLASVVVIVVVGRRTFGIHPAVSLGGLVVALVLANICGRATGETDLAPVGAIGTLTQFIFGGKGHAISMITGWITMGSSSQTSQTLWAFRAGARLGASPKAQVGAQILGAMLGALVVVPVYLVLVRSYGLGTEAMPAPSALSWKATAEAVRGGLSALPPYGPAAGGIGIGIGILLTFLGRARFGRFVPSPAAMGAAMLLPASLSVAAFAGAATIAAARRLRPGFDEQSAMALAAGGIAGESLMGVFIAILIATGVL